MSKKTRPRRHPAPASTPRREDPGTLVERLVGSLWQTVGTGDLLRAELEAATCLALPRVGQLAEQDAKAFISKVLVDEAVRQPSADGAAVLRLLMSLGSPATKRSASQALARLTQAGIYPPDWVTEAGKAVPVQAWRRYDVFGDDEAVAVTFRYGDAEHGIVGQIDLAGIPVAVAAGVAADAARLIQAMSRDDDPFDRVEQIGLAEARRRLEAPLARCDEESDPGLSVDTLASLPVARSRLRRLPAEDASLPVFGAADRAAAVDLFMKSPLAAEAVAALNLPGPSAAAAEDATRFWAQVLSGYSSRIPGEPPGQVGPRKIAHLLLGHVPNTFSLTAGQRQHLEPAVSAWIAWSAEHRGLDEAATARLTESLPEVFGRFGAAYDDPEAATARSYLADLAVGDADVARLSEHVARRMFAVPMPPTPLDISDPGVRRSLVEDEFAGCTPHAGLSHEEFMAAVQRVVDELWDGNPEETFAAARHLFAAGADRHDIIHTLAETPTAAGGQELRR